MSEMSIWASQRDMHSALCSSQTIDIYVVKSKTNSLRAWRPRAFWFLRSQPEWSHKTSITVFSIFRFVVPFPWNPCHSCFDPSKSFIALLSCLPNLDLFSISAQKWLQKLIECSYSLCSQEGRSGSSKRNFSGDEIRQNKRFSQEVLNKIDLENLLK